MHSGMILSVIFFAATHKALSAPLSTSSAAHTAQVMLPYGQVVGNRLELADEYLGIPYAQPPLTRFEAPVAWTSQYPNGSWTATEYSEMCLQPQLTTAQFSYNHSSTVRIRGSEDCLHLNIYTPRHSSKLLPVMLWIHGITGPAAAP